MATTPNEEILDRLVRHIHWLERYKSGEVRRIISLLNEADTDLVRRIADRIDRIGRGANLSKTETKRLEDLVAEIRAAKEELGYALYDDARGHLDDFAEHEVDFKATVIEGAATVSLQRPSASLLRAVVTARPFNGRFLREWYEDLSASQARAVTSAVRIGIVNGQTTDQIVRRIRGTRALQYQDGVLEQGRRQVAAVVRTAIAHVANQAAEELYSANDDLIDKVQWVSTLDGRTTAICRSLDGKLFDIGKGPRPPQHFGCRSTTIPYLGSRDGNRASMYGPVPRATTYEQWLRKQPPTFQDEVLGKGKAKLFREGLSIDAFVDESGQEYTLQELKQLDRHRS